MSEWPRQIRFGDKYHDGSGYERMVEYNADNAGYEITIGIVGSEMVIPVEELGWVIERLTMLRKNIGGSDE